MASDHKQKIMEQILKNRKDKQTTREKFTEPIEQDILEPAEKRTLPTKTELKKWYSHINRLEIKIYVISTKIPPYCKYCEIWKHDTFEQKWLMRLHELLAMDEEDVSVKIVHSDWNALHLIEYEDKWGDLVQAPLQMSQEGRNYFKAYGNHIGYFPGVIVYVDSKRLNTKGNLEKFIFEGVGDKRKKRRKFQFGKEIIEKYVELPECSILSPLLRFLKYLDPSEFPKHDKVSHLLGQYHRHTNS